MGILEFIYIYIYTHAPSLYVYIFTVPMYIFPYPFVHPPVWQKVHSGNAQSGAGDWYDGCYFYTGFSVLDINIYSYKSITELQELWHKVLSKNVRFTNVFFVFAHVFVFFRRLITIILLFFLLLSLCLFLLYYLRLDSSLFALVSGSFLVLW